MEISVFLFAAYIGLKAGSAAVNFEIEAGLAYNELLANGVSEKTALNVPSTMIDVAALRQQLIDRQHQQSMDELAAEYEKNVGNSFEFSDENTYTDWLNSIGVDGTKLNSLARYNEAKYNDSPDYQLLSGYGRAVEKGDISPLVGFAEYEHVNKMLEENVVGITTSTGVKIESFSTHFIDRVIGQTSTAHSDMRLGVQSEEVLDALQNPVQIGVVRKTEDGDTRQTFYGAKVAVTVSLRDKRIIQTNPLRRS